MEHNINNIAYLSKRQLGLNGWDSDDVIAQNIAQLSALLKMINIKQGSILDVGCGAGNISFWLESLGYTVFGIDVSSAAIQWAQDKANELKSTATFKVHNAANEQICYTKPFDIVIDCHCLHCIISQDREYYLRNLYNCLAQGGAYILTTMCSKDSDIFSPESENLIYKDGIAIRYIGKAKDVAGEIASAGFAIVFQETITDYDAASDLVLIAYKV